MRWKARVFVGGAVIQWLRDEMRFFTESRDAEYYAQKVSDNGGVYLVPAFTGLGAPYWDMYARGCILGITRGTKREHIIRAAQESIAYQVADLVRCHGGGHRTAPERPEGGRRGQPGPLPHAVPGGHHLDRQVRRPAIRETTALGAAYLAGLATGVWQSEEELSQLWKCETAFQPEMDQAHRDQLMANWHKAVGRSRDWAEK